MQSSSILDSTKQKALEQLRKEVEDEKIIQPGDSIGDNDWTLLRFLRARNFNVKEAKQMLTKCQEWRKSVEGIGIDALYDETDPFDYPEREVISKYWPIWYHKTDKQGRPFCMETLGKIDVTALYQEVDPKVHWRTLLVTVESVVRELMPACAKVTGEPIDGTCFVVDLSGFGLRQFWQMKDLIQKSFQVSQDYYPETIGRIIVINAPATFTMIWAIVKPWLSQITIDKVEILGYNYIDILLEYVDAENLPSSLGGKCTCEGLGGCNLSSAGPWLEGRVYHGTGQSKYTDKSPDLGKEGAIEQNRLSDC